VARIRIHPDFFERAYIVSHLLNLSDNFTIEQLIALILWNKPENSLYIILKKNESEKILEAEILGVTLQHVHPALAIFLGMDIVNCEKTESSRPHEYKEHPLPEFTKRKTIVLSLLSQTLDKMAFVANEAVFSTITDDNDI